MEIETHEAVRAIDLFSRLDEELLAAITEASHVETFTAGQRLITQGAAADGAWIILDGEVELLRNGDRVASYGPGKMVGDLSLLSGSPHSVDAVALISGRRLVLGVGEFRAAVRNHPEVAFELIRVLVERIYHMQDAADRRSR